MVRWHENLEDVWIIKSIADVYNHIVSLEVIDAKVATTAPPTVTCRAHDRSTGAEYDGLRLCGVPSVGHFLTLLMPGGKRAHFRIEDVQHVARVGTGAARCSSTCARLKSLSEPRRN